MLDRQDFFALMSAALAQSPANVGDDALVPPGRAKTRILEAHPPEASLDGARFLLHEAAAGTGLVVDEVGDELWRLKGDRLVAFIDTLNPRFWQLHSTSSADEVTRFVRHVVFERPELDTAWLPSRLLRQLDGEHLYWKSEFEADALLAGQGPTRRWRARFEGDAPEGLLEILASDERYASAMSVTGVGSIVDAPGVGSSHVVATYLGTFVTGGGDFSVSASAVWNMVRHYETWVRSLEERHRVSFEATDDRVTINGDVATIAFGRDVNDVDLLVEGLFAAKAPFRLWAVPRKVADDEWYADAVDLHVGHPLRVHITRSKVSIVLDPQTCGNTIARLLTNLQHHLDARSHLLPVAA
jgi:hypothetical protein